MKVEFSTQQIQMLYEIIGKCQITGQAAKPVAELQTVIEKAVSSEGANLAPKEEKKK